MKIKSSQPRREQGSVLIITLTFGGHSMIAAASYLTLVGTQKTVVSRSQNWNAALTMAEAGIEEGMAQINSLPIYGGYNYFTNFNTSASLTPQDFSFNSWGTSTNGTFGPVTRNLAGGYYTVSIRNEGILPSISSTGFETVAVAGANVSRSLKVTTVASRLASVGLGAVGSIDMNGNGIAANSFNSHSNRLSTNGQYDPSKTSTNGDVASVGGIVDIGQHTIAGDLYLGPTASYANNGTITGDIFGDYNVQFPDVTLPAGANGWPTAATTDISGTATYDFRTSGNYTVNGNHPIVIEPGVTVALNVTATTFAPASLKILGGMSNSGTVAFYLNGPTSVTLRGNDQVGATSRPENLWYFGLPSLTSMTFGGTTDFVGVIYAPEVNLTLNGGGNGFGIMGSVIVNSVQMNGHYDLHYDEALASLGPIRGYVPSSWQEY